MKGNRKKGKDNKQSENNQNDSASGRRWSRFSLFGLFMLGFLVGGFLISMLHVYIDSIPQAITEPITYSENMTTVRTTIAYTFLEEPAISQSCRIDIGDSYRFQDIDNGRIRLIDNVVELIADPEYHSDGNTLYETQILYDDFYVSFPFITGEMGEFEQELQIDLWSCYYANTEFKFNRRIVQGGTIIRDENLTCHITDYDDMGAWRFGEEIINRCFTGFIHS